MPIRMLVLTRVLPHVCAHAWLYTCLHTRHLYSGFYLVEERSKLCLEAVVALPELMTRDPAVWTMCVSHTAVQRYRDTRTGVRQGYVRTCA